MRVLKLNSLCGLKNQMYSMEQYVDYNKRNCIKKDYFDINSLFWSKIFAPENVKELLKKAKTRLKDDNDAKIQAILHKPSIFFETYTTALKSLSTPVSKQSLFQSLETLEIICYLHTKLISNPFKLSISCGYMHSQFSALDLFNYCLLPYCNPYLSFVETEIVPKIVAYKPDILLLMGKPNIASFAIAKIAREKIPRVFIVATEYESDYYSLKKIKHLLINNTAFFSAYHCVIFNNTNDIIQKLKKALIDGGKPYLLNIPGIMYSTDNGKTIHETPVKNNEIVGSCNNHIFCKEKKFVYNMRAFPQNHCYWNRCTFCGINSKYSKRKNKWDTESFVSAVKILYSNGIRKIWLLDESIPVRVLRDMATQLLSNNIHIIWHVRTRIETEFIEKSFIDLMWKSGLRHISFGFECASNRMLKLTQKFDESFNYLEIAERIIATFTQKGIKVHFSSIVGFPTETESEIKETADFLKYMNKHYNFFSYNVNLFYLDIGSKMYRRWDNYGITSLSFPCSPKYFLENQLDWNSAVSHDKSNRIQNEQENLMALQYPWFPQGALLTPSIFFAFWEYSRYVLEERNNTEIVKKNIRFDKPFSFSKTVSFLKMKTGMYLLYNLENHHYVVGGDILKKIYYSCITKLKFIKLLDSYKQPYRKHVELLIMQLARMNFFE